MPQPHCSPSPPPCAASLPAAAAILMRSHIRMTLAIMPRLRPEAMTPKMSRCTPGTLGALMGWELLLPLRHDHLSRLEGAIVIAVGLLAPGSALLACRTGLGVKLEQRMLRCGRYRCCCGLRRVLIAVR